MQPIPLLDSPLIPRFTALLRFGRCAPLLLVCAGAALLAPASAQQPVIVETVRLTSTQQTERVIGSLRARTTSVMAALEEGAILELPVREAQAVAAGAILARIDVRRLEVEKTRLKADQAMAQATLVERQAQVENAKIDLQALVQAADSGAVSERDLRNARTRVETSEALAAAGQAAIESLEAAQDLLDIRIADSIVRAPFAARITMRHAAVGEWVHAGDPLVTLISDGPLEAWLDLPERFAGRVHAQTQAITLKLEATGQPLEGSAPRFIPMVSQPARTFPLLLDVPAQLANGMPLHAGMSISALLPLGQPEMRLVLGQDAILRRGNDELIAKVGAENLAELVPIRTLFPTEGGFAVEALIPGSLAAGDQVVIEGNERLFPGTPVLPTVREKAGPKEAPSAEGQGQQKATPESSADATERHGGSAQGPASADPVVEDPAAKSVGDSSSDS